MPLAFFPSRVCIVTLAFINDISNLLLLRAQGMIMAAEDENGNFSLIVPEKDVASGTVLG